MRNDSGIMAVVVSKDDRNSYFYPIFLPFFCQDVISVFSLT